MKKLVPLVVLVLSGLALIAVACGGSEEEANKTTVRRFVEEVENAHNLDAIDELFAATFVDSSGGLTDAGFPNNLDGWKQFATIFATAFPDTHFTIRDMIAEDDKVVTYKTFSGTHQGEFAGIPPTNKQVTIDVIDIFRVEDGKLTEHWAVADELGLLQQLGLIPSQ